ncbi:hypothetical protein [Amycolatopsis sp. NPDC004169]|uniref:hypothetical protein n=1 Tax=Amycolatopsis sp. NPDC004169 TaxID=3154453 RepID=UPI0033A63651
MIAVVGDVDHPAVVAELCFHRFVSAALDDDAVRRAARRRLPLKRAIRKESDQSQFGRPRTKIIEKRLPKLRTYATCGVSVVSRRCHQDHYQEWAISSASMARVGLLSPMNCLTCPTADRGVTQRSATLQKPESRKAGKPEAGAAGRAVRTFPCARRPGSKCSKGVAQVRATPSSATFVVRDGPLYGSSAENLLAWHLYFERQLDELAGRVTQAIGLIAGNLPPDLRGLAHFVEDVHSGAGVQVSDTVLPHGSRNGILKLGRS